MGLNIGLIAAEMQRLVVQNKLVNPADMAKYTQTPVDSYCKKISKVKGTYQVLQSVMTHVVQGFSNTWTELGTLAVSDKELKNYHQKVNFGIVPADVLSTALAEWYEEGKEPSNQELVTKIATYVLDQIKDDMALLSMVGEYDPAQLSTFGKSMNGWNKILANAKLNTAHPVYKIPLNTITSANILDEVLKFEKDLPEVLSGKITKIFMSKKNLNLYKVAYKDAYKNSPNYSDNKQVLSPLEDRELIGLTKLSNTEIFATVDGNMLKLIDVIDNPTKFTDVQVADYKVKLFWESWLGYDFLINEAVCVADFTGTVKGLGNAEKMALYFPHE